MERPLHFKKYLQVVITFIIITSFSEIEAKTTTAVLDGNWNEKRTWNNGVPADGDVVNISAGNAITFTGKKDLKLLQLYVYSTGFLNIDSDKNLEASIIYVYDGGKIETEKEIKLKSNGGKIIVEGTIIANKLKLEGKNQTLVIANTGLVKISEEFKAEKSGTIVTINGLLSGRMDLKLGKGKEVNHITGSGSVTAGEYKLSDGSTIFGIGSPISDDTELTGTYVWTGGASSGSWNTSKNWDSGIVPPANGGAKIPATGVIYWPTIGSNESYTVKSLLIESDQNGTGSLIINGGSLTINEKVSVESYVPSNKWHIISSPVSGQDLGPFAVDNNLDMFSGTYNLAPYYEHDGSWKPFNVVDRTTNEFAKAKGYILKLPENDGFRAVTYSGNSIYAGTQTIDIDYTVFGWNSVGNPYTSAIRINAETNSFLATNAEKLSSEYGGLYFWDNITDDFIVFGKGGSDIITSGQGFVLKCKERGRSTITFNSNMQVHSSGVSLKSESTELQEIDLYVKVGDLLNTTNVKFIDNMTIGLDPGYDVGKLKGNPDIALYTKLVDGASNVDFAVQALPDLTFGSLTIPVGLDLAAGGNATFYIETSAGFPKGTEVYLEDTELQILTKLNEENSNYEVTLSDSKGAGRFNLVIKNYTGKGTITNTQKIETLPRYYVFTRNKLIFVNGPANKNTRLSLYSIDGKIRHQNYAEDLKQNKIDGSNLSAGIYILKVELNGKQQSHKVVLTEN